MNAADTLLKTAAAEAPVVNPFDTIMADVTVEAEKFATAMDTLTEDHPLRTNEKIANPLRFLKNLFKGRGGNAAAGAMVHTPRPTFGARKPGSGPATPSFNMYDAPTLAGSTALGALGGGAGTLGLQHMFKDDRPWWKKLIGMDEPWHKKLFAANDQGNLVKLGFINRLSESLLEDPPMSLTMDILAAQEGMPKAAAESATKLATLFAAAEELHASGGNMRHGLDAGRAHISQSKVAAAMFELPEDGNVKVAAADTPWYDEVFEDHDDTPAWQKAAAAGYVAGIQSVLGDEHPDIGSMADRIIHAHCNNLKLDDVSMSMPAFETGSDGQKIASDESPFWALVRHGLTKKAFDSLPVEGGTLSKNDAFVVGVLEKAAELGCDPLEVAEAVTQDALTESATQG